MTTRQMTWSRVGFLEPAFVERLLVRGALVGGLGALVGVAAERTSRQAWSGSVVAAFAVVPLLFALPRQRATLSALLLGALGFALLVVGTSASTLPFVFAVPLGAMLALEPMSAPRKLLALVGPSLGVAWALVAARWLGARHLGPLAVLHWAPLFALGLFAAAGASLAYLHLAADELEHRLPEDSKVLQAWLRLRRALRRLPVAERAELHALAVERAERWLAAREEVRELVAGIDQDAEGEARAAVDALTTRLADTTDPELRALLEQQLRVHADTLEQLAGLRRRSDRADARAAAESAWLDTAAFTVELAPRQGAAKDLVDRLRSLARERG